MRIQKITATAFGPLKGDTLDLASGMNVIYGPNESGKSTWHSAIYAALCGLKKTRGQPSREDRDFASRHKPWSGTTWRVTTVLVLDDGRTIEIEQGLGSGSRSVATDRTSNRPLAGSIVNAGAVDATTLLGLTRESALATLFVRQADVLRVLTEAGALQEFVERAAASNAVDTTAEEALEVIALYRREAVGLLRVGARAPLATASAALTNAKVSLDNAEERFDTHQALLARRHALETEVNAVEMAVADLAEHQREARRRERWFEIRTAERRLEQARGLVAEASDGEHDAPATKALIGSVTAALAAFEARPPQPPELDGPTAEQLEQELAEVPDAPEGDLEPSGEVTALLDRWRNENQRLVAHREIEPVLVVTHPVAATASELRRLADDLERPLPDVDPGLAAEVELRRTAHVPAAPVIQVAPPQLPPPQLSQPSAPSAHPRRRVAMIVGASVAVLGAVVAALGPPVLGGVAVLIGVAIALFGVITKMTVEPVVQIAPPTILRPPEPTPQPAPDFELPRLEARLALQQEARAEAQRKQQAAATRAAELNARPDPGELRQLAEVADVAATAQSRHSDWQRRRDELNGVHAQAAALLEASLASRGVDVGSDLDVSFNQYADGCRQRAVSTRRASRRTDLAGQLASRRSAETACTQALDARVTAEQRLVDIALEVGIEQTPVVDLSNALREWVLSQHRLDEQRQAHAQTVARLDQVLDGSTIHELERNIGILKAEGGAPPPEDDPPMEDRTDELEASELLARRRRDALAELVGEIESTERQLIDLSCAIEAEARADSEVRRLTQLGADLDLASEILTAAQRGVHADLAPVLENSIRPWVARITRGRYDDVRVNPATLELQAREVGGEFRSASVLSHGTTEQLFLLLRLALVQWLTTTDEKAPIVLDDITVQSDTDRTLAALELLHELSTERQIVLFSQEDEVLRWAEEHLDDGRDRLVRLQARG